MAASYVSRPQSWHMALHPPQKGNQIHSSNELAISAWLEEQDAYEKELEEKRDILFRLLRPVQRPTVSFNNPAFDYYRLVAIHSLMKYSNYPPAPLMGMNYGVSEARNEPMWLYIVAAIGAAALARIEGTHTAFTQPLDMKKYDTAAQMYSKALREHRHLQYNISSGTMEPLIIACYQLFAYELMAGNHIGSLQYLRYMKAIFRAYPEWAAEVTRPGSPLGIMTPGSLSRLEDKSMPHRSDLTPRNAKSTDERMALLLESTLNHKKYAFESIDEASAHLEGILDSARKIELDLQRSAQEYVERLMQRHPWLRKTLDSQQKSCLEGCASRIVELESRVWRRIEDNLRAYTSWRNAFDMFDEQQESPTPAMLFLQIRAICTYISISLCRQTKETKYDRFTDDFVEMVDLAEVYLEFGQHPHQRRSSADATTREEPIQSNILEWGLLRALYIVCVKCRAPATRKKARRLLTLARRREGLLDSLVLAEYGRAVIALEERRAGTSFQEFFALPGQYADRVSETARFCDVVATGSIDDAETFSLVCGRFMQERKGFIQLTTYKVGSITASEALPVQSALLKKEKVVEVPWRKLPEQVKPVL